MHIQTELFIEVLIPNLNNTTHSEHAMALEK